MKQRTAILAITLALTLILGGCGPDTSQPGQTSATTSQTPADAGYAFKTGDVTIHMHDDTGPILEQLGEEKSYFEAASCAFPGLEKTYTYSSFSLYTYEDGERDRVASIVILDDSVGTAEGIYLNDSLDDIIAQYGNDFEHSVNLYTYTAGRMQLSFIVEDDIVTSIEYIALSAGN